MGENADFTNLKVKVLNHNLETLNKTGVLLAVFQSALFQFRYIYIGIINTCHHSAGPSIPFDLWSSVWDSEIFLYLFMDIFTAIDQERCENRKHLENWNVWHFLTGFLFFPIPKKQLHLKKDPNKNHSPLFHPPSLGTIPLYEKNFRNIYSLILFYNINFSASKK